VPIKSVQMPSESWVLADQVRTLSEKRIQGLLGTISDTEMETVLMAIFRIIRP